jgi:hypothetical protein
MLSHWDYIKLIIKKKQMVQEFSIIGKKIKIYPQAVPENWKKPRIGEIVDEEICGETARDVRYFIEVEKEKSILVIGAPKLLLFLKNGYIEFM